MKRIICASALCAFLLVPGNALGATEGFSTSGKGKRAFTEFQFKVFLNGQGKPARVGFFKFNGVDSECTEGPLTIDGKGFGKDRTGPNAAARVEDKRFRRTYESNNDDDPKAEGTFRVKGRFKNHFHKVVGSFRVRGDFPLADRTDCDSDKEPYTAGEN
jgi:hypothetical protein